VAKCGRFLMWELNRVRLNEGFYRGSIIG